MTTARFYPIGTPGKPWTDADRRTWFNTQDVQRSYHDEVRVKIAQITPPLIVEQYGALPIDKDRYPLFGIRNETILADKRWILITGGVHGYETSGVQGALAFAITHAADYIDRCNLVIAPCVSPWGYEVIHRWNPDAIDPNRSFVAASPSAEAALLMQYVASFDTPFLVHIDLHETTDSDESEFRPALAARDGKSHVPGTIPDGFYTVGDTENPQPAFQRAVIEAVAKVTHIAASEADGTLIGMQATQPGVINYKLKEWGLCAGMTNARFTTTTEVYPDSPNASPEICNAAQVAAVKAALDFALNP